VPDLHRLRLERRLEARQGLVHRREGEGVGDEGEPRQGARRGRGRGRGRRSGCGRRRVIRRRGLPLSRRGALGRIIATR
jgi:hypothetical protein